MLDALYTLAAVLAGAIASVAGFGIGSILTPLLSLELGTRVAVAAASVPHLFATALRFWLLRRHVDRHTLVHFGILSAAGGLAGAVLHATVSSPALTAILGAVLVFAGTAGVAGVARGMKFGRTMAWAAGGVSGLLGGLVGNQGGIRSAALLGFNLERRAFVATATGIGLIVDAARMPAYFITQRQQLAEAWPVVVLCTAGVLLGTVLGARFLRSVPEVKFQRLVGGLILALGVFMIVRVMRAAG